MPVTPPLSRPPANANPRLGTVITGLDYAFTQRFMGVLAIAAIIGHPVFYVLDHHLFGMRDSLLMRGLSVLVSLPPLFFPRERPLRLWHKVCWEIMIGHMLLVTFVYNFVLNDFNTYWYASLIFAGLLYGFCSRLLLVVVLLPSIVGASSWLFLRGRSISPSELQRMLEAYAIAYLSALVMAAAGATLEYALQRATRAEASLREVQARLLEQEKLSALGRLLAQLSHEINNPINVVANNLQPLRDYVQAMIDMLDAYRASEAQLPDGGRALSAQREQREIEFVIDDAPKAIQLIEQAVHRVHSIQADLRAFIRGQAVEMKVGSLKDEIAATIEMLRRHAPPGVTLVTELGELPPQAFNAGQLGQALFNLVQNAIDAMQGQGQVVVRTAAEGDGARIDVSDTGPGVPAELRKRIFEPFFTTKDVGRSSGLGLAVCRQIIVENHHGSLELDADHAPGARFVIRLPRLAQSPSTRSPAAPPLPSKEQAA
jgi:signal transduction histidine kinase